MSWLSGSSGGGPITYGRKPRPSNAAVASSGSAALMLPSRMILPQILEDESFDAPGLAGPSFSLSPLAEVSVNRMERSFSDSSLKKRATDTPFGLSANPKSSKPRNLSPTPSKSGPSVSFSTMKATSVAKASSKPLVNTLRKGVYDHINYLKTALSTDECSSSFQGMVIRAPAFKAEAASRFREWMEELGFKEDYRREQQVFLLAPGEVDQFKRIFSDFLVSYNNARDEQVQPFAAEIDMEGGSSSTAAMEHTEIDHDDDYLWKQETGEMPPPASIPVPLRLGIAVVNLHRSSFDSEAGSTPTAESTAPPTPSALSPTGSFSDTGDVARIISAVRDDMTRLKLNRSDSGSFFPSAITNPNECEKEECSDTESDNSDEGFETEPTPSARPSNVVAQFAQSRDPPQKEVRWSSGLASVSPVMPRLSGCSHHVESPFMLRRSHPPVGGGRGLSRSKSESEAYYVEHSSAGHVTPGPVPVKVACSRQFSTPNAMIQKVISGTDGIDWGISKPADQYAIDCMLENLERTSSARNRSLLRRHVSMDDKILNKSPIFGRFSSGASVISPAAFDSTCVMSMPLASVQQLLPSDTTAPLSMRFAPSSFIVENARSRFRQAVGASRECGAHDSSRLHIEVGAVDSRHQKRVENSKKIKRRMSHGMSRGGALAIRESLYSPATPAKFQRSKLSTTAAALQNTGKSAREVLLSNFTVRSFKNKVIGGVYQHSFDADRPVFASASAKDTRVTAVAHQSTQDGTSSLDLKLYHPKDKRVEVVSLGSNWLWTRTAPDGYLVSSGPIRQNSRTACYYLSRHPEEWAESFLENSNSFLSSMLDESGIGIDMSFASGFIQMSHAHDSSYVDRRVSTESNNIFPDDSMQIDQKLQMQVSPIFESSMCMSALSDRQVGGGERRLSGMPCRVLCPDDSAMDVIENGKSHHCDNPNIVAFVLSFLFERSDPSAIHVFSMVSKSWAVGYYKILTNYMSESGNCQQLDRKGWVSFMNVHNWGKFLSSGACKNVYCVQDSISGRFDAVSVMDVVDLEERGMDLAVRQETEVALLCSALVTLNICPNLVLIHSIFQSSAPVSDALWNNPQRSHSAVAVKLPPFKRDAKFQYMRMEYCRGGDLEGLVRSQRDPLAVDVVRLMLFQMCYSLYACRDQISLRHYDLKLLNFFVTHGSALLSSTLGVTSGYVLMNVAFGPQEFILPLRLDQPDLVKLSDFGTSCVGSKSLGDPITIQQFTTLENSPPEYLFLGSSARQSYSADTFSLGLCMLHLLTGEEPYEELLSTVCCPKYLVDQLRKVMFNANVDSPYYVITELVGLLDDQTSGGVIFDTIYRYLVLFGGCDDFVASIPWDNNPVWLAVVDALGLLHCETKARTKNLKELRAASINAFARDSGIWSVHRGTHPIVERVRQRLDSLGPNGQGIRLFDKMTHFDPARRCTMHEAILSPVFAPLRSNPMNGAHAQVTFSSYRRNVEEGGTDALSLV